MTKSQLAQAHGISYWLLNKLMEPHLDYIAKKSTGVYTPAELVRVDECLGEPMGKCIGPGELAAYYNVCRATIVNSWLPPFRAYVGIPNGKVVKFSPAQLVRFVEKLDLPDKTDAFFSIVEKRLQLAKTIGKIQ